jgi:E3 ubiquitin-protein ligase MYLIP
MDYFGLTRTQDEFSKNCCEKSLSSIRPWINLRNALRPNHQFYGNEILLDLKIKFWVPPHLILQENVRNIFYMQACKELLEGRLKPTSWEMAAQLISLIAQADGLKYNSNATTATPTSTVATSCCSCPLPEDRQQKRRRLSKRKASETSQHECDFVEKKATMIESRLPTSIYDQYLGIVPSSGLLEMGEEINAEFVKSVSMEHQKLAKLKVTAASAKYWLLDQISHLSAFGEEKFTAALMDESQQEVTIGVSPDGLQVYKKEETLP